MEFKILKEEKDSLEIELDNLTIAEILRVYLNKNPDVSFTAWKREHPTKKPILIVKGKNPKKSIRDTVAIIIKELDKISSDFSKLK